MFNKGDVVKVEVPFSDFSGSKIRPIIIIANMKNDFLGLFITSSSQYDLTMMIKIKNISYIRLDKPFYFEKTMILGKITAIDDNDFLNLGVNYLKTQAKIILNKQIIVL